MLFILNIGSAFINPLCNGLLRVVSFFVLLWSNWFGPVLTLDSGIEVRIGPKIAEGGFSIIYQATEVSGRTGPKRQQQKQQKQQRNIYALKRIRCDELETRTGCIQEGKVHYELMRLQGRGMDHTNTSAVSYTMPLLGMCFCENNTICYMLFPYLPHSLRKEVNQRIFAPLQAVLDENNNKNNSISNHPRGGRPNLSETQKTQRVKDALRMPPWSESIVLQLFDHLCEGVSHLHSAGYSHRDIKLENILLFGSNPTHLAQPVLMDFGSAGPVTQSLASRRDVLNVADMGAIHTTISYRPPELFAGELRTTSKMSRTDPTSTATTATTTAATTTPNDSILDYTKVDVWMLGCTLFAILFGASPNECEFSTTTGQIRIVDCTHNKVLGPIVFPLPHTPPSHWYSPQLLDLITWMCTQDRHTRPTLVQVQQRVKQLVSMNNGGTTAGGGSSSHVNHNTSIHASNTIGGDGGFPNHDIMDGVESQQIDVSFATKNVL